MNAAAEGTSWISQDQLEQSVGQIRVPLSVFPAGTSLAPLAAAAAATMRTT